MEPVNLTQATQASAESARPDQGIGDLHVPHKPLYEKFGAKPGSESTDRQLAMIWEWAEANSPVKGDRDAILWEVTKLSNRLGSASFNDKPWTKLSAYVSTWRQQRALEERLKGMEANG